MNNTLNATTRRVIYLITALGTPLVAYLAAKGVIDHDATVLWSAEVAVAGSLAALKTGDTDTPDQATLSPTEAPTQAPKQPQK